jgi:HK97 family phage prohead protease
MSQDGTVVRRAFEVAEFKALGGKKGEFEALVSVFGNVDRGGDRVMPGAFGKTLAEWGEKGDPIPIIWNHMWDNPEAHIGAADPGDVVETDDGLFVKRGRIDLDNPFAAQVYRLLSERRVKEFSFGYSVRDAETAKDGAYDLLDLDLFEIGPTLKGMNPATELLAVKSLAAALEPQPAPKIVINNPPVALDVQKAVAAVIGDRGPEVKAGARHSKETLSTLRRLRAELDALIGDGDPAGDEPPKSDEAEATGKASDPDADIHLQLKLLKEQLS